MKTIKPVKQILFCAAFFVAVATAGCGGGGVGVPTGSPAANRTGKISLRVKIPEETRPQLNGRTASSVATFVAGILVATHTSTTSGIPNYETALPSEEPVAVTSTCDFATESSCSASFSLPSVDAGQNQFLVVIYAYIVDEGGGQTYTSDYYFLGAPVDVQSGSTTSAVVDIDSTYTALAMLRRAVDQSTTMSKISSSDEAKIASAVAQASLSPYILVDDGDVMSFENSAVLAQTESILETAFAQAGDTTKPTVSSFNPANGATNVPYDGAIFKVIFSESMDSTVTSFSGFSVTVVKADSAVSTTINSSNASSYGSFSWMTTSATNDTLAFTLKSNSQLAAAGLFYLKPGQTYDITSWTAPTNVKDLAGNTLSTTGISTTGSFTTTSDATAPTVDSFDPADGATNVDYDGTTFKVIFSEAMDSSVASFAGYSITVVSQSSAVSLTINSSNASSYGAFSWTTTTFANDTLAFTLKSSSQLEGAGLKTLKPSTTYDITSWTAPSNLTDAAGNALDTTGVPSTGSFTTAAQ